MLKKHYLYVIYIILLYVYSEFFFKNKCTCVARKVQYISTERPKVVYINHRYLKYLNLTSQRYGRETPFYYVGLHFETLFTIDYNVFMDFYFYEYLTNVYKRSFVEMHFEICHMLSKDRFFGAPMRQGKLAKPCPFPPDTYHLYNMSIDTSVIPPGFPFQKGRIYCNVSSMENKAQITSLYIDMELKEVRAKKRNKGLKVVTEQRVSE